MVETTQKTTQKILELIAANPRISRIELAAVIGITADGIKYQLDKMRKDGVIKRVGPDKGGALGNHMKPREWAWFKRRSAIEPIIGHTKSDHRMDRNYLKGEEGDRINAILAACGFNIRKLLRAILLWLFKERFRQVTLGWFYLTRLCKPILQSV